MAKNIRNIGGIFIILHGIAHLMATSVYWKLNESPDLPYDTTILGSRIDLGEAGIALYGVLWLIAGLVTALSGVGLLVRWSWARQLLIGVTLFSLAICLLVFEAAKIGIAINIGILSTLLFASRMSAMPTETGYEHVKAKA